MQPVQSNASGDQPDMAQQLARIAALLETLPARLAAVMHKGGANTLKRDEREALAILLPALVAAAGDRLVFTAAEALGHVATTKPEAIQALEASLGTSDAGLARRLGRLLARAEGVVIEDLNVQRIGATRTGMLWQVKRV